MKKITRILSVVRDAKTKKMLGTTEMIFDEGDIVCKSATDTHVYFALPPIVSIKPEMVTKSAEQWEAEQTLDDLLSLKMAPNVIAAFKARERRERLEAWQRWCEWLDEIERQWRAERMEAE